MATAGVIQLFKEVTEIFLALQEFQILAVAGVRLFIDVKAPTCTCLGLLSWWQDVLWSQQEDHVYQVC